MFGCNDHWLHRRFADAEIDALLTRSLRGRLTACDTLNGDELRHRFDAWRADRAQLPTGASDGVARTPEERVIAATGGPPGWTPVPPGREWIISSNSETVELGRFDPTRPPIVTIDSGDIVVYADTWTHFLNKLQPGMSAPELAALRKPLVDRGVHSIIGPIAVRDAKPGDMVEIRFLSLRTIDFGANFHNAAALRTGALPDEFTDGHVHYFALDPDAAFVEFSEDIRLELRPFQGTFGVAAPGKGAISSVAPGQHAGNIDVKELTVGTSLFVPVFHDGALLFTGDSHALQGDGEVNITAIETAMKEVRVQIVLHQNAGWEWPFIETPTHWLALGMDPSLNEALRIALRNTIAFLAKNAGLSREDAYGLASLGVDFRISQMVDVNNGVHAMIPKSIFAPQLRATMSIA